MAGLHSGRPPQSLGRGAPPVTHISPSAHPPLRSRSDGRRILPSRPDRPRRREETTMRDRTPMLRADLIASLVLAGAFSTACRPLPATPLTVAAAEGDLRKVKDLIASGADVNSLHDRFTALDWAARKGRTDV